MAESVAGLRVDRSGVLLDVQFDVPSRKNAVTAALLDHLATQLSVAATAPQVRAILISGRGGAFCAGADLSDTGRVGEPDGNMATIEASNAVVAAIQACPKPVIAAVRGPAAGVGCSIALACDLVIASESAYFTLAFAKIGLMPDGGATAIVPAAVGRARAMEMALLGGKISAAVAMSWGLINRVLPDDTFDADVKDLVAEMTSGPTAAYAATKQAINAATLRDLEGTFAFERDTQLTLLEADDYKEGRAAFLSRRRPEFTGT